MAKDSYRKSEIESLKKMKDYDIGKKVDADLDREYGKKGSRQRKMMDAVLNKQLTSPSQIAKTMGAYVAQPFVKAYDAVNPVEKKNGGRIDGAVMKGRTRGKIC